MKRTFKNITLQEKINQENKEINEIIGKAIRSQAVARKYEDKFKEYGIEVDYNQSQGVTLKGPNGKVLDATKNYVGGPAKPSRKGTHAKYDTYEVDRKKEYEKQLADMQAMKRDDIIRAHPDMSSKEALRFHKERMERLEDYIREYEESINNNRQEVKQRRREGHLFTPGTSAWSREVPKAFADSHIDYLNYLTKPSTGDDFRKGKDLKVYKTELSWDDGDWKEPDDIWHKEISTKNPVSNERSDTLKQYDDLKYEIKDAKDNVEKHTYNNDDWYQRTYGAMTDKQLNKRVENKQKELEKEIARLRKDYEEEVKELKKQNITNRKDKEEALKDLKAKKKELDDFLKAKGVREAARYYRRTNLKRLESVLKESIK